jgi:hypothetical protein
MPLVPLIWEAEAGRSLVPMSLKLAWVTYQEPVSKNFFVVLCAVGKEGWFEIEVDRAGRMGQEVEHLHSKHEALSIQAPVLTKKKKKKSLALFFFFF